MVASGGRERTGRLLWRTRCAAGDYPVAFVIGLSAVAYALPWATIGGGGLFVHPVGDLPQNLVGHLAFQATGWDWTPLRARHLVWPAGESIALMDSNPALSLAAKLAAPLVGHPVNLFGAWLAACLLLQPVAAVYALRGLTADRLAGINRVAAAAAAALLALLLPAFLFRTFHINLMGQFLLLLALGGAARLCRAARPPPFAATAGFLTLVVMVHPYLFVFAAVTLAAPVAQLMLGRDGRAREAARNWAAASLAAAAAFMVLNGTAAGGGPGFGLYSMNLLGPVWPQYSGLFAPARPPLDATGYQAEGFNYLGAGTLVLLAAAAAALALGGRARRGPGLPAWAGLGVVLCALAALAVTPRLTAGPVVLVPLPLPVVDQVFAVVRASGRAIWVVDYALLLAAIGMLAARLRPRLLVPLVGLVVVLQWLDTAPLRAAARFYFAGVGQVAPAFVLPPGTTLLRMVPICGDEQLVADRYRLIAVRAGARLADVRPARPLLPGVCAEGERIGLETALAEGEARLFLPTIRARVRRDRLGAGVACRELDAGLLCVGGPAPAGADFPTAQGK